MGNTESGCNDGFRGGWGADSEWEERASNRDMDGNRSSYTVHRAPMVPSSIDGMVDRALGWSISSLSGQREMGSDFRYCMRPPPETEFNHEPEYPINSISEFRYVYAQSTEIEYETRPESPVNYRSESFYVSDTEYDSEPELPVNYRSESFYVSDTEYDSKPESPVNYRSESFYVSDTEYDSEPESPLQPPEEQACIETIIERPQLAVEQFDAAANLRAEEANLETSAAMRRESPWEIRQVMNEIVTGGKGIRYENMVLGDALQIQDERLENKKRGVDFNDSLSPGRKGLIPEYQSLSPEEERLLTNTNNPVGKLIGVLASSVTPQPQGLSMALHSTQGIISDSVAKVESKKETIEYNNFKIDKLRAEMRLKESVAGHKKYTELQNKVQAGHCPDSDEKQKIGELQEKIDEDFAKIRTAEILGRAKRLELEQAAFSGKDPNLVAPPVDGSNSKFENTRLLETLHGKLSDPMLKPAVLGASVLVYGEKGPTIAKVTNAGIDITKQQLSKETNSKKKMNSVVAIERSEDFQDRVHYYETTEQMVSWLAEKINSMEDKTSSGSAEPGASISSPKGASLSGDNYSRIYKETNDTP